MYLYTIGNWKERTFEELGLPVYDNEIHGFQDYKDLIGGAKRPCSKNGDDFGWSYAIYEIPENRYICSMQKGDSIYVEFIIADALSLMFFEKEYKDFTAQEVEEYIQEQDGRWIKIEQLKWFAIEYDKESEKKEEFKFIGELKDGEKVTFDTVANRAFYMKRHFGFTIYAEAGEYD